MRRRIQQLAKGKFEYLKPEVMFSDEKIEIEAYIDEDYEGSFTMTCTNETVFRGVIYSTNPKMECLTPQFDGKENRIRYKFHTQDLKTGVVYQGNFIIVYNGNEYTLPYQVEMKRTYPKTSLGEIKNLEDFAKLAKAKGEEAYQLFYHKSFVHVIGEQEEKALVLYRGITESKPSPLSIEEFLIGVGLKDRVHFSIEEYVNSFENIRETKTERLLLHKDEWGYLGICVESDCDFLIPERNFISSEHFIGSGYTFSYKINASKLHAGKNFGKLTFTSNFDKIEVEIQILNKRKKEQSKQAQKMKECKVRLMELYQEYRLKRVATGVWAEETVKLFNQLLDQQEDQLFLLMKAQVYVINHQRAEAEEILDAFKKECDNHRSVVWGYYLYIMSLIEREPAYIDRITREIQVIFREHSDSFLLFWILLFLDERYATNNEEKLKEIKYWVRRENCISPFLYLEAYYLYCQEPYLLEKLGTFELRVLRWAMHHHAFTKEIAMQIFSIVEMSRKFDPIIFQLLVESYETCKKPENLGFICSYLIKGQQCNQQYHDWFRQGIEQELRITNLYEAYLLSMDEYEISRVPRIIQMYFQYESKLPYNKMVVLYNNIIAAKKEFPQMYEQYRKAMGRFAMEQVELEHMDDNLAVLYADMLDLGLINEDIARSLSRILFTRKLVVFDEKMVRAVIYHKQLKEPQIVPIVNKAAYFQNYTRDFVILFEDEQGKRYSGGVTYSAQQLMTPETYLQKCMKLAPEEIPYLVSSLAQKSNAKDYTADDIQAAQRLLKTDLLNDRYQNTLLINLMRCDAEVPKHELLQEYLPLLCFDLLSYEEREFLLSTLMKQQMYEEVYTYVREYGFDYLDAKDKATLAMYVIEQTQMEEDETLLQLVFGAFTEGEASQQLLEYLVKYYHGATSIMFAVWKAATAYALDVFDLEERILSQMLYADYELKDVYHLFSHYYENGGQELIVLAFLSSCAHAYFVDGVGIEQGLVNIIESRYLYHMPLNDTCQLCLLKNLSERENLSLAQHQVIDELLLEYTRRNIYFDFYKKFPEDFIQKYHLYDKVILEYRADSSSHVMLHYKTHLEDSEYTHVDMSRVYDGIFAKNFVLFFGEVIEFYISEEKKGEVIESKCYRLMNNDVYNRKDESRYNLLNQMTISDRLLEEEQMMKLVGRYDQLDKMTEKFFKVM